MITKPLEMGTKQEMANAPLKPVQEKFATFISGFFYFYFYFFWDLFLISFPSKAGGGLLWRLIIFYCGCMD